MASKLTKWINAQLKAKGKSSKEAQKMQVNTQV